MNFLEARTYLRSVINRTDFPDELAKQFIVQSQDRLERWPQVMPLKYAPRPSFMQKYVTVTLDAASGGSFLLPSDFLEIGTVHNANGEMVRVPLEQLITITGNGCPTFYTMIGHQMQVRPLPVDGTEISFTYYGTVQPLVTDTDENEWTLSCIDALVYGAAEYAADYFEDERLARFANKFKEALVEIQDQTLNETFSGSMAISPAYDPQDDC